MKARYRQFRAVLAVLMVLLVTGLPGVVLAAEEEELEKDTYAGLDINFVALNALGQTFTPLTMRAKLGLVMFPDLIPVLSLESQFGFTLKDDMATIDGEDISLWISNYIGLYARASHQLEEIANLYGLLGFATVQVQGDKQNLGHNIASGLSVGVGAQFALPFDIDGNIELMQLVNGKDFDAFMLSFGVSYKM